MNCQDNEKYLAALVDDEVAWWRKVMIKMHLKRCEYCEKMFTLQKQMKNLVQSRIHNNTAPESLKMKVRAKLDGEKVS